MNKITYKNQEFVFPSEVTKVQTTGYGVLVTTEFGLFRIIDSDAGPYVTEAPKKLDKAVSEPCEPKEFCKTCESELYRFSITEGGSFLVHGNASLLERCLTIHFLMNKQWQPSFLKKV